MHLSTDSIHLVRTSLGDYNEFKTLLLDPVVTRMNGRKVDVDTLFERYLKNIYSYSVFFENKFAGLCSLFPTSLSYAFKTINSLEIVYSVVPDYWNKGIATCSVNKMCCMGFNTIGLDCIVAGCYSDNIQSYRVLQNNGFKEIFSRTENDSDEHRTESIYLKIGL